MRNLIVLISWAFALGFPKVNAQDSLRTNRHQIGLNAANFLVFLEEQKNDFDVTYRRVSENHALRVGLNYYQITTDDGRLDIALKVGYDRNICKNCGKWDVYYGVDLLGGYESFESSGRKSYRIGLAPFIGVMFHLGKNFSISTEPSLYTNFNWYKETKTFSLDNTGQWFESGLGNVGQLQLNVLF